MAQANIYKGFDTSSFAEGTGFAVYNVDCIRRDLLRYINTIPGDYPHDPTFGTRIPTMVFEPNDEESQQIVIEDIQKAVNFDPRLRLLGVDAYSGGNALVVTVKVLYIEFDVTEDLNINIKN